MEKAYKEQSINLGFGYGDKDKWLSGYLWWERIRFHELSEFDEAKRSCRRRLAGHNERRRKNPPESQEGPSRKGSSPQVKGNHCRQADEKGRLPTSLPGNGPYKHFQIR